MINADGTITLTLTVEQIHRLIRLVGMLPQSSENDALIAALIEQKDTH
jgi:hypothetical protein